MSQNQLRRPPVQGPDEDSPITYGDVFPVAGGLAGEAVAPRDAAMMQSAENRVLGQTPKGSAAAVMESAATWNEQRGLVSHNQYSDTPGRQGVSVTQTEFHPGERLVTEFVAGQAVGQYVVRETVAEEVDGVVGGVSAGDGSVGGVSAGDVVGGVSGEGGTPVEDNVTSCKVTIGDALEATVATAGDKPVEASDAAAIQAAEATASGTNSVMPGGVAAAAQAAAAANAMVHRDQDKTTLADVVADASMRLPLDKEATREDAERVAAAEMRNNPDMCMYPGGIGASLVAAARLNKES